MGSDGFDRAREQSSETRNRYLEFAEARKWVYSRRCPDEAEKSLGMTQAQWRLTFYQPVCINLASMPLVLLKIHFSNSYPTPPQFCR